MADPGDLRRVAGDGRQRVLRVHAGLHRHGRAHGQILNGGLGVVGADGHLHPCPGQKHRIFLGHIHQLRLAPVAHAGSGDDPHPGLGQQIRHPVGLRPVDDHIVQPEFPADAHRRGDIVRPVGMEVGGQGPRHHIRQGFQLHIQFRLLGIRVLHGLVLLVPVLHRLGQILPDDGRRGHTGHRRLLAVVIHRLGILAQGEFHGHRSFHNRLVHPAAVGFDGRELSGDGVGAARAGEHRGHAPLSGLLETAVLDVHPVNGPQMGGAGVGGLVAVVRLKPQAVAEEAQVAVGVHKAGDDMSPFRVQHFSLSGVLQLLHRAHTGDLLPFQLHIAMGNHRSIHGMHRSVDNQHLIRSLSTKLLFDILWKIM